MPKVQITTLETGELEINYICECGCPVRFITYIKPKRLPKCFDCNIYCPPFDPPVSEYLKNLKTKQRSKTRRTNKR